jgi:amino acid adenylation domain-containing protein
MLPVTELQDLPEGEREREIERSIIEAAHQRFDLERGPLYRAQLLRVSEDEHVLLWTMHHIVSDGWSMGVMLREAAALYKAFSQNQPSTLPALPVQYADYAVWQRNWLQGEVLDQQLSYWRRQLADAPPAIDLPTDRPRPPIQSFRGANVDLRFGEDLTAQLKRLSRRENATLYMTLLAAFKVLLARITRQECVVVGTPVAGRRWTEIDRLIGFFVNTLVLRTDVSSDLSFSELLAGVRRTTVEAYSNQDVPFEKLVDELQPQRDLSRSPLFQVMFNFGTVERESGGFHELAVTVLNNGTATAKFDVTLALIDAGNNLNGSIEYNTDLFDEATIVRFGRHYLSLLESIVANPERPIPSLSLLSDEERRNLLSDWNQTAVDYPLSESVPEIFERQVISTPDATAVTCGDSSLTYDELNRRANQLGHYLQALGVGAETRVGIMVQRSADMVVGLLAILKAGGAYVPLDPAFPRERLSFMMDDAKISVLLTQRELIADLRPGDAIVVLLDADWSEIEQESSENLTRTAVAENLAYLIYTSGSTGNPKGVQISHRALTNLLWSMQHQPGFTSKDVLLSVTTLSFDIAGLELCLPLISGGRVAIVSRAVASDGIRLKESLETIAPTVLQATPATWQMLIDAGWQGDKHLKVFCGGEALPRQLADALLARSAALWNMYGPTETTIYSVACRLESDEVMIGRPIANTQLYVLDGSQQPVPVGVLGELYIGGEGLARGYQNQPALTAEAFVPDSFSGAPGGRLYRTGDLVRYLPDGNLVYLARADRQTKIRGFRVEPREIEAVLRQHDRIRDVAVVASGAGVSERRLIAYVVMQEGEGGPEPVELREFLKERIPEYMLPDAYVTIDEVPLTANGKVDYRTLESKDAPVLRSRAEFVAPRNTLELQLAQIWEDILNISRASVMDKFFEIGGNSILAVRLMRRIEKQFGKELPLAMLFQAPTIEQLASVLSQYVGPEAWRPLVAIQPRGTRPPFFCVHPIGGTVLCYYDLARYLGEDQPFYAMQAPGLLTEEDRQTSIEEMATLYNRELREVQPSGPYRLGGYSFGGIVAFEMAQQLLRDGESVALVALFDGGAPKNVAKLSGEIEDALILAELLKERARSSGQELQLPHEEIFSTAPEERLSHVLNLAKTAGVVPMEVELDWIKRFLHGFKLRAGAASRYMPSVYPGCLTYFRSTDRDQDTIKTMQHAGVDLNDHTFGWSEFSAEPIEVIFVPGYHETLMLEPYVQTLAERLRWCLDRSKSTNLNEKRRAICTGKK